MRWGILLERVFKDLPGFVQVMVLQISIFVIGLAAQVRPALALSGIEARLG